MSGPDFQIFNTILSSILSGNTFYVSIEGDDTNGTGTLTNPLRTIKTALARADNGATVIVQPGNYEDSMPFSSTTAPGSCNIYFQPGVNIFNIETIGVQLPAGESLSIYGQGNITCLNGSAMVVNVDAELYIMGAKSIVGSSNTVQRPTVLQNVDLVRCTTNSSAVYYGDNTAIPVSYIRNIREISAAGDTVRVTVDDTFKLVMHNVQRIINEGTEQAVAIVAPPNANVKEAEIVNCNIRALGTTNAVNLAGTANPGDSIVYISNCTIKGGTRPVNVLTGNTVYVYDSILVGGSDTIAGGGSYGFSNVTSNNTAVPVGPELATPIFDLNFQMDAAVDVAD